MSNLGQSPRLQSTFATGRKRYSLLQLCCNVVRQGLESVLVNLLVGRGSDEARQGDLLLRGRVPEHEHWDRLAGSGHMSNRRNRRDINNLSWSGLAIRAISRLVTGFSARETWTLGLGHLWLLAF